MQVKFPHYTKASYKVSYFLLCTLLSLLLTSCDNLDKDGGYYDSKTKTYKYVFPGKKGLDLAEQTVQKPRPRVLQIVKGVVMRVESPKRIWVRVKDRQTYMILAQALSRSNRNDKDKEIRFILEYVSPMASVLLRKGKSFKQQWKQATTKVLELELLNQYVAVQFRLEEKAGQFRGVMYELNSSGKVKKNVNLWMVQKGLSYYIIERGAASQDKEFLKAQSTARSQKEGIWKHQKLTKP
ncbi:MAG: hypothetical protein ACI86H_000431 [bacterium]|jgi:hypothetical protein